MAKSKRTKNKAAAQWQDRNNDIPSDVLGSYTGNPEDLEKPVQDADDL